MEEGYDREIPPELTIEWFLRHFPSKAQLGEWRFREECLSDVLAKAFRRGDDHVVHVILRTLSKTTSWMPMVSLGNLGAHLKDLSRYLHLRETYPSAFALLEAWTDIPSAYEEGCKRASALGCHSASLVRHQRGDPHAIRAVMSAVEFESVSADAWNALSYHLGPECSLSGIIGLCDGAGVILNHPSSRQWLPDPYPWIMGNWIPRRAVQSWVPDDMHRKQVMTMLICKRRGVPKEVACMIAAYVCTLINIVSSHPEK